jgi:hypothetical protein
MPKVTQYKISPILNEVIDKASFFIKDNHGREYHVVEVSRLPFFEEKIRLDERKSMVE